MGYPTDGGQQSWGRTRLERADRLELVCDGADYRITDPQVVLMRVPPRPAPVLVHADWKVERLHIEAAAYTLQVPPPNDNVIAVRGTQPPISPQLHADLMRPAPLLDSPSILPSSPSRARRWLYGNRLSSGGLEVIDARTRLFEKLSHAHDAHASLVKPLQRVQHKPACQAQCCSGGDLVFQERQQPCHYRACADAHAAGAATAAARL
jgi:hypothetical protein